MTAADDDHPNDAAQITLSTRVCLPEGAALVHALAREVIDWEAGGAARQRQRRETGLRKLRLAMEALVGGLLLNAARAESHGAWSYQPLSIPDFTGEEVTFRQFRNALKALVALGLVEERPAFTRLFDFGEGTSGALRRAARYRPTPALWARAEQCGLSGFPGVVRAFHRPRPQPPITLRALSARVGATKVSGQPLPIPDTAEVRAIAEEVTETNRFLAGVPIEGCAPVSLGRVFTHDLRGGGRWYAAGEGYQGMRADDRVALLRINGAPVVEVDARASFLALLHGLTGTHLPEGDPYEVAPGLPREVVKAWVARTIGRGLPPARWSKEAVKEVAGHGLDLKAHRASDVGRAVLSRYPFLSRLPSLLGCAEEPRLCSLRLQRIEAEALTLAMRELRGKGIPALPMHDALIIPADASGSAVEALSRGYLVAAGVVPVFRVKRP